MSDSHSGPAAGTAASVRFELTGGALCLDFANTVDNRPTEARELLQSYGDLVSWAEQAGVVDAASGAALRAEATRRPRAAESALVGARALREALYSIFSARAAGRPLPAEGMATLNAAMAPSLARLQLDARPDGACAWRWSFGDRALDGLLAPVVDSAAELLTAPELARVRECEADNCGWLFVDRSRNRSRRWCDMAVCGNRAKVRRHYARAKQAAGG
jgi:predicted RNA-binding Zn ribbon-like protein